MAETLITAPAVPKKVFLVGVFQKDETGSVVEVLHRKDVIATTAEAAKATAIQTIIRTNPAVDLTRVGVTAQEVATV